MSAATTTAAAPAVAAPPPPTAAGHYSDCSAAASAVDATAASSPSVSISADPSVAFAAAVELGPPSSHSSVVVIPASGAAANGEGRGTTILTASLQATAACADAATSDGTSGNPTSAARPLAAEPSADNVALAASSVAPLTFRASRHTRTPNVHRTLGSARRALSSSIELQTGIWLLLEDANEYLDMTYSSKREFWKLLELDSSRHIEQGASVYAEVLFCRFDHACALKDAPAG